MDTHYGVYGLKINAHMEKGNTHYGIRNTVYGLLNTRIIHGKLALLNKLKTVNWVILLARGPSSKYDVYRRHVLTSKADPRTERVK